MPLITGATDSPVRRAADAHDLPLLIKPVSSSRLLRTLRDI